MSETVLAAFAKQIDWCNSLGSPFTARILAVLSDDLARGGATADLARATGSGTRSATRWRCGLRAPCTRWC